MSKSKKIILIVVGAILFLFLTFVGLVLRGLFEVDKQIEEAWYSRIAKNDATEYYEEKYGEKFVVTGTNAIYSGGFMFDSGSFTGYVVVESESCNVLWHNGECWDNKQYDEICQAIKEKYFYDKTLGTNPEISVDVAYLTMDQGDAAGYLDYDYLKDYYDGDIESFIAENTPTLNSYAYYDGYPENADEYREIVDKKLNEILQDFKDADVAIYVFDPRLDLPEMEYSCYEYKRDGSLPFGDDYMEMIVGVRTNSAFENSERGYVLYETNWNEIDEYTAICDIRSDEPLTESDYIFKKSDLYKNETAIRGRYSGVKDINPMVITRPVYDLGLASREDIFLRLDREYYEINENTAPLLVFEQGQEKVLKYVTVGWVRGKYTDFDSDDSWYYLDDECLYLYIGNVMPNLYDAKLTFVNISEIVLDK